MNRIATWLCLPAVLSLSLLGCGSSEQGEQKAQPQLSTQQAALVQEAAVGAVSTVQGPLLADLLVMQTTGRASLLVGDAANFTLDTELAGMLGGTIGLKGKGWADAHGALLELEVALVGMKGTSGVTLDGLGEMAFDLRSVMPLELIVSYSTVLDVAGALEADNALVDLVISVSDTETLVCGTVAGINISNPGCAGGKPAKEANEQQDPSEEPAEQDDPSENLWEPGAPSKEPEEEEPVDVDPAACDQESYQACTDDYTRCVNSCDPLADYQLCVGDCSSVYCDCMDEASCIDPTGRCDTL